MYLSVAAAVVEMLVIVVKLLKKKKEDINTVAEQLQKQKRKIMFNIGY